MSGPETAELARRRGAPLLEALDGKLPNALARSEIAATLAGALASGPEGDLIAEAARLQEIGKLYVPAALLGQPLHSLNPAERAVVESHQEEGRALALGAGVPERICAWILHARERWDGTGPGGLRGTEIPEASRIVAVCREYLDAPLYAQPGVDPRAVALQRLAKLAGTVLDPGLAARARGLASGRGAD